MAQKTINVGTVANDGTGDTIRGAFTNVNANFTEVYGNIVTITAHIANIDLGQNSSIQASYTTANIAYNTTNASFAVANAAYNNANVGLAAANSWANTVGSSTNSYIVALTTAGNNYTSTLAANNAVGANGWTNTVSSITYAWANSTFTTLSNTSIIFNTTNAAFSKANTALANTNNVFFNGDINFTGNVSTVKEFKDPLGTVRERPTFTVTTNASVQIPHTTFIANNSSTIYINIPNDNQLIVPANIGTTIQVYQCGSGDTKIYSNDAAVTVYSSNNWANIAGQYLSATAVKVLPNTWILTGDLKP